MPEQGEHASRDGWNNKNFRETHSRAPKLAVRDFTNEISDVHVIFYNNDRHYIRCVFPHKIQR